MEQEVRDLRVNGLETRVPDFIKDILAEITFQARSSSDINQHSGVSCRVSIRSYEAVAGHALKHSLVSGEKKAVPRITDLEAAFPAIAGKLELEYEIPDGNQYDILENLTKSAVKIVFDKHFAADSLQETIDSFQKGMTAEISSDQPSENYLEGYKVISGLKEAVGRLVDPDDPGLAASAVEFILEGLHLSNKLNREVAQKKIMYS
jgi:magnesium chelatase subunit I